MSKSQSPAKMESAAKATLKKRAALVLRRALHDLLRAYASRFAPRGNGPCSRHHAPPDDRRSRRERRRQAFVKLKSTFVERLEPRVLLTGNPVANNDSYVAPVDGTLQISAPGLLSNDTDPNQSQLTAHLVSGPTHPSSFHLNSDGSVYYTPAMGYFGPDSFTYYDTDGLGYSSNTATVSLADEYSVSSEADITKQVPIGELKTGVQVLGGSGSPATAQNLALAYDSVAAHPDAVIEGTFQFNFAEPINDTVTGTLDFNGARQPATYVNLAGMQTGSPNVDLSYQVDTSALPTWPRRACPRSERSLLPSRHVRTSDRPLSLHAHAQQPEHERPGHDLRRGQRRE